MKHLGDITKLNGSEVPVVDIVCGGSPCQDLSVAGRRAGLQGERSGLFMEQIRLIKEMRDECRRQIRMRGADEPVRPRFMVWENVPGAFSSNGGEDFRAVLEETARIADPGAVIPKPQISRGGGGNRQDASWEMGGPLLGAYTMRSFGEFPSAARGSRLSRILEEAPLPKYCLSARACSGILRRAAQRKKILPEALDQALKYQVGLSAFKNEQENQGGGKGILIQDEHTGALSTFNNQAVCYDARGNGDGQTVPTITGDHNNRVTDYSALLFEPCNWDGEQVAPTLTQNNAGGGQRMPDKENFNAVLDVAYGLDRASFNQGVNTQYNFSVDEELIGSMTAKGPGAVCNSVVRRLTPTEEERLQGFPDGWTDIGEWVDSNGKRHKEADTPRYKALGNSIALPFWEWMAVRMLGCLGAYRPTMASLFDGIGGFPLAFSRAGCKPVWASEIEEFPIAVTKIRFPEED